MANSMWGNWLKNLGMRTGRIAKRTTRDSRRWELASELLECRAMLSATTASAPVAAEVAHSKASFEFPNVGGTWDIAIAGVGEGTAVLTQNGAKVTGVITVEGFAPINTKAKFTKAHPHSLLDTTKLKLPEVGKILVKTDIEFPEGSNPTTFTGDANINGDDFTLTGTKQGGGNSSLPNASAKAAPTFENITGTWDVTASSEQFEFSGLATFTQDGKGGKFIHGNFTDDETGAAIAIDGKFIKKHPSDVKGTATVDVEGTTVHAKFTINYDESFDSFDGTANAPGIGEIELFGDRVVT
jgi:hypothetical protein